MAMAQAKGAEILELTRSRMLQEKEEALRELQERVETDLRGQWEESLRTAMENADKVRMSTHVFEDPSEYYPACLEKGLWYARWPSRLSLAVSVAGLGRGGGGGETAGQRGSVAA